MIVERSGGERVTIAWHDSPGPHASVLVLPALGVSAAYYAPLAETLSRRGLAVAAVDHRGLGGSSVRIRRGVDFGYAALIEDTRIVIRSATPPVFVLGHSLGGHVAALAATEERPAFEGLALVASGTPYHERFVARESRWIRFGTAVIPRIADVVGYYPGKLLGFGGSEARTLMTEWAAVARTGHFVVDGENRDQALAQVALPVLAVSLDHDWMAPASAVDHLVEKMPRAHVQRVHLSDAPRETLHHFRWARHPAPIVEIVDRWIQEVMA